MPFRSAVQPIAANRPELERANSPLLHPIRYGGLLDELDKRTDLAAMRLVWDPEFDLLAHDSGTTHVPNRNSHAVQAEAFGKLFEPGNWHTE